MGRYKLGLIGICIFIGGCASFSPQFVTTAHDPLLDKNGGVVLLADVCIKRGRVFGDDYVVVAESKTSAEALVSMARNYLSDNGVQVRTTLIPFVCGAWHDSKNPLQKVANNLDDNVRDGTQPFDVSKDLESDSDYVHALTVVATYAFQQPFVPKQNVPSADQQVPLVSLEQFRTATAVVTAKTQASSILYIGVSGLSRSAGQNTIRGIGTFLIGVPVGMATAIATQGFYVVPVLRAIPDSRLMSTALIAPETANVPWSNAVSVTGDPLKLDVDAAEPAVDLLLSSLVRQPASTWSPPGIPPRQ